MGARYSVRPSALLGLDPDDPAAMGIDYMAFQAGARVRSNVEGAIGVVVAGVL